jgi:predicted RNA-binding protein associated with RNAse of E/G family
MPGMNNLTIYKCNSHGKVVWQYPGQVLRQDGAQIVIDSTFNREDIPFQDIIIKRGDRFIETFHTDRWYNIFEIHDVGDGQLKGWYCNICRPAVLKGRNKLLYEDLALDLWVTKEGRQVVLDDDEFEALELDEATRAQALAALAQLQDYFYCKFRV